jgi:hypothetical protein
MLKDSMEIGTWPTPEKWDQFLEVIEFLDKLFKPDKTTEEISVIIRDFRQKICKTLEASIRSDIGCLCKYKNADLCEEPKIKECLTRLIKTAPLYQQMCCER